MNVVSFGLSSRPSLCHVRALAPSQPSRRVRRKAFEGTKQEVHRGMYRDWKVQDADIAEVLAYRAGITITSACTAAVTLGMVTDAVIVPDIWYNTACVVGGLSFGVSLWLIHMYVAELKLLFQIFFGLGAMGGAWLMVTQDTALPLFVAEHQWATWAVGPAFAAVTGVAIKEGLCYGKIEAALLALVTPVWLLTHLAGPPSPGTDTVLGSLYTAIFCVFALRKFSQRIKDDIGDKSIFEFLALPPDEQAERNAEVQGKKAADIGWTDDVDASR